LRNSPEIKKDQKGPGKLSKALSRIPERLLLIILILTMLDMLLGVFTRYVTGKAIYWAEEVGTFGLVWMTMVGTGIAVKKGLHFSMPTFVGRFPPGVRYGIALANHFLIILFGALMFFTGTNMTLQSSNMFSPALEVNLGILNSAAIACGVLIVVYEGQRGLATLRRGSAPSPEGH
jgi:TRAP-type C4-dicarboxylate transport system permease small subunit